MHITTRGRYAVRAVLRLATAERGSTISIHQIAETERISPAYLEQLFIRLSAANVVTPTRGSRGGYRLSREAGEITIEDILDAVDETIEFTPCTGNNPQCPFSRDKRCTAREWWGSATECISGYFSRLTLEKVLHGAGPTLPTE